MAVGLTGNVIVLNPDSSAEQSIHLPFPITPFPFVPCFTKAMSVDPRPREFRQGMFSISRKEGDFITTSEEQWDRGES